MFKFLRTKQNKQLNKKSKIVSEDFIKEENIFYNIFDNPYNAKGIFTVIGIDNENYTVEAEIDGFRSLKIKVKLYIQQIYNINLYGNFDGDSKTSFFLERVESINQQYKNFGWGTILMECMLKILKFYCEINNYTLCRIYGTIGVGGGDISEKSMRLYSNFDNHIFDDKRNLHLQHQGFNLSERKLEYLIA